MSGARKIARPAPLVREKGPARRVRRPATSQPSVAIDVRVMQVLINVPSPKRVNTAFGVAESG